MNLSNFTPSPCLINYKPGNALAYLCRLTLAAVLLLSSSVVFGQTVVINPVSPWVVPAGVTSIKVECWGGGGGGGGGEGSSLGSAGGGGGGGGTSIVNLSVSQGQSYVISMGTGGPGGSSSGGNGSNGGVTSFTGPGGSCTAYGGTGGVGDAGVIGGTVAGGTAGTGGYAGGQGIGGHFDVNNMTGGGGGGGAGNAGPGGNGIRGTGVGVSAGGTGGTGNPNAAPYTGGKGGNGPLSTGNAIAGVNGTAPGGGGGGATNYSGSSGAKGGNGATGQVIITYSVIPTCTMPCAGWIAQNCSTCTKGCYIDAGAITPSSLLQTKSTTADTGNYGYLYWTFNASADSTYYFDLCSSTGTSGVSWLRLHSSRITNPDDNYCMNVSSSPTIVLQNMPNGCAGTGTGLSKLIWTCKTSGTYFLESAIGSNRTYWGVQGSQTAILSYKTLPSSLITCSTVFYDKGIDGTDGVTSGYNNNEDWIYTYYPTDTLASAINVQFVNFSTSPGDILCVFNGNSINAPQIGCYSGPSISGTFSSTASDGSLTFQFTSDDSLVSSGWEANVSCVPSLGIGSNGASTRLNLFPNPVKDRLEITGLKISGNIKMKVVDLIGNIVYSKQYHSESITQHQQSTTSIELGTVPSGVYFLQIENGNEIRNARFVKQ